jgi:hypothetical protein
MFVRAFQAKKRSLSGLSDCTGSRMKGSAHHFPGGESRLFAYPKQRRKKGNCIVIPGKYDKKAGLKIVVIPAQTEQGEILLLIFSYRDAVVPGWWLLPSDVLPG